jgi:hypothetical protein
MPLHVLSRRNAGQQRRRPSRTLDFKMKHSPLHHQPYKNECTTIKTRRRKPLSPPSHTLPQDSRPDPPQCSLPLPATPRRLILQQSAPAPAKPAPRTPTPQTAAPQVVQANPSNGNSTNNNNLSAGTSASLRSLTDGLIDPPPTLNESERQVDWTRSYHGLSSAPFTAEQSAILQAELHPDDIEIKPDGILYLPEIKYRRILNKAFGPGGWGLAPRGETIVTGKLVTREYGLVCGGR